MDPLTAGTAAAAGPGIGAMLGMTGIQAAGNIFSTIATNRANIKMQDRAFAYNRRMWDMANEYNLPANQVQRLRDAGLNPSLMYGGSMSGGIAQDAPEYKAPQLDYRMNINPMASLLMYQDMRLKKAQIDQTQAMTNRLNILGERDAWNLTQSKKWDDTKNALQVGQAEVKLRNDTLTWELNEKFSELERDLGLSKNQFQFEMDKEWMNIERSLKVQIGEKELDRIGQQVKLLYNQTALAMIELQFERSAFPYKLGKEAESFKGYQAEASISQYDEIIKEIEANLYETARITGIATSVVGALFQGLKLVIFKKMGTQHIKNVGFKY